MVVWMKIEIDSELKTINVNGTAIAWEFLNFLGLAPVGRVYRILKREAGVVTVKSYNIDIEKFEAWCVEHEEELLVR